MGRGKYDFDTVIDRKNTSSLKYDFGMERKGRADLLPLWVADMDFRLPDEVLHVIEARVRHGIFGYTDPKEAYYEQLYHWMLEHYNWKIKSEWNTVTPGVVYAIAVAVRAYTQEGDAVLIQQPVYYPFSEVIADNNRTIVNNQLRYEDGRYEIDFEDFEEKIVTNHVKLFIFCSPHNPVGRVWTRKELEQISEICIRHNVIIVSDEIHADFIYEGHTHIPLVTVNDAISDQVIVCTSPSKTFNIAGLQIANILIPNEELRKRFRHANDASGYSQGNAIGITACQAVYEYGEEWYQELKQYLKENLDFVREFLGKYIPDIKMVEPEGTYLLWLDCQELVRDAEELEDLFVNKAKLWIDEGKIFGTETALFVRMNMACPRKILEQALEQLKQAVQSSTC